MQTPSIVPSSLASSQTSVAFTQSAIGLAAPGQRPEPTVQQVPAQNIVGGLNPQYYVVKHNIQNSIKSVHVSCDNQFVVFGAMRKIFFKQIDSFFHTRKMLLESKISHFGSKMSSQMEVQQIECHPRLPSVVASVSGNAINVWDLERHESATEVFSIVNQITSIGWQHSYEKVIATAAGDNLVCLFDVRQNRMASKFNLNAKTDQLTWNPCKEHVFATSHESEVKIWDVRKLGGSSTEPQQTPLQTLKLQYGTSSGGSSASFKMQFDPTFGQLFMTQDKNMMRLFSVDKGTELDHFKQTTTRPLIQAQFLPLRDASAPGLIALPQRSLNFLYFQVEEGQGKMASAVTPGKSIMRRVKNSLSDRSGSDNIKASSTPGVLSDSSQLGTNTTIPGLRMVERKAELVAPKLQMTSPEIIHDNDAFAVRVVPPQWEDGEDLMEDPRSEKFQIISVTSFGEIRFMTLNQTFIEGFYDQPRLAGLRYDLENIEASEGKSLVGSNDPQKATSGQRLSKKHGNMYTPSEQRQREVDFLQKLAFVAGLTQVYVDEASKESGFTLNLRVKGERKYLGLEIDVPEVYPRAPVQVEVQESFGVTRTLLDAIETSLQSKAVQRGKSYFQSITSLITLTFTMLGGNEAQLPKEADEFDFDNEEDASSDSAAEAEESKEPRIQSPKKRSFLDKVQQQSSGQKAPKMKGYFAYPKTCGFSWNCYGQFVFFANGKYNLQELAREKSLKKFTEWPQHYNSILANRQDYLQERHQSVKAGGQGVGQGNPQAKLKLRKLIEMHERQGDDSRSEASQEDNTNQREVVDEADSDTRLMSSSDNGEGESDSQVFSQSSSQSDGEVDDSRESNASSSSSTSEDDRNVDDSVYNYVNMTQQSLAPGGVLVQAKPPASPRATVPVAFYMDDDANIFAGRTNKFKVYLHSFGHMVKERPSFSGQDLPEVAQESPLIASGVQSGEQYRTSYDQDLVNYWNLVQIALSDLSESKLRVFATHPLGKVLLLKVLRHFEACKDIQQVAIIASLLFRKEVEFYERQRAIVAQAQVEEQVRAQAEAKFQAKVASLEKANRKRLLFEKAVSKRQTAGTSQGKVGSGQEPSTPGATTRKSLAKNNSVGNLLKRGQATQEHRATAVTNAIKYAPLSHMPSSLQDGSSLESHMRYGSPDAATTSGFGGLMQRSGGDSKAQAQRWVDEAFNTAALGGLGMMVLSQENSEESDDLHLMTEDDTGVRLTSGEWNLIQTPNPTPIESLHNSGSIPEESKARFANTAGPAHGLSNRKNQSNNTIAPLRVGVPTVKPYDGLSARNQSQRHLLQQRSRIESAQSPKQRVESPGSPTLGGILNTNGDKVENKHKKSLAGSFRSRRNSDYSAMGVVLDGKSMGHVEADCGEGARNLFDTSQRDLLSRLDEARERYEGQNMDSTSADSSSSLFTADSDQNDDQQQNSGRVAHPEDLSLILKSDPILATHLLLYLKRYSELLHAWRQESAAVEACKLIAQCSYILRDFHHYPQSESNANLRMLGTNYFYHQSLQVYKREMTLADFVLYAEHSLGYVREVSLSEQQVMNANSYSKGYPAPGKSFRSPRSTKQQRQIQQAQQQPRVTAPSPFNQDELLAKLTSELESSTSFGPGATFLGKCAICDQKAHGLVFFCPLCKHGGHFEHMKKWASLHPEGSVIPCPTGCGCQGCFRQLKSGLKM